MDFGLGQFTLQIPPWDERTPAQLYADTIDLAAFAESVGFGSFWLAEHHGSPDSYIPSLLPFLSAIAARTSSMHVGTGVMLAPFHNPIRLAEDAAVVDQIARGRLRLGLGLGWVEEEYRMFGVPMQGRGRRLEEIVAVLRHAWTGEPFSFAGRFYNHENVRVTPRPFNGSIPVFLGGGADTAVERAAVMGDGHYPASVAGVDSALERARLIAKLRADRGLTTPYRYGCFLRVGLGKDFDDGWASIRDGVLHIQGSYYLWAQGARDTDDATAIMADHEASVKTTSLCGTPKQVAEALKPLVAGIAELGFAEPFISVILAPPGTPAAAARQRVETFAEQVIPALTD